MDWSHVLAFGEENREGNQLEAKLAKGGLPASLWETYSSFANTEGGIILLGVKEETDGTLAAVGVPDAHILVKKLWDGLNNPSKVSANILADDDVSVQTVDGAQVVCIQVPRASRQLRPVYVGKDQLSGTYRRNGEGDYHCSPEEIAAMVRDASPTALDALVLEEFGLDTLSRDSVERFRAGVEAVRPNHPWTKLGWEDLLIRLNAAGRRNGKGELHPTRAGLLMFGYDYEIVREYPDFFLDYREMGKGVRWADRVVSHDGTWTGNVFDFWTTVLPRLVAGVKQPFALGTSLQRIDDTDMRAAVREQFVNALVHSDYYGRRGVVVLRYPDRIEVSNPGNLRVALDVALAGGVSDARNPTVMKMFGLLNACEKAGSGFDVMREASLVAQAREPQVTEQMNPDRVEVVLHLGNAAAEAGSTVGEAGRTESGAAAEAVGVERTESSAARPAVVVRSFGNLSVEEATVLTFAQQHGLFGRKDVEQLLGCKTTKAKGILAGLVEKGAIVPEGAGRSARYRTAK